jgi:hypothetical protein
LPLPNALTLKNKFMALLYCVTLRSLTPENTFQFLKLQLVAKDQLKALKLATEKAEVLGMEVTRLEEIQALKEDDSLARIFSVDGVEYAL